MNVDRVKALF